MFFESIIEDFLAFFLDFCFYCSTGFAVNYIRSESGLLGGGMGSMLNLC